MVNNHGIDYEPYADKLCREPFDFYGGGFYLGKQEKMRVAKERIIRFYEARLIEQQDQISKIKDEMEQLIWMNESAETGLIDTKKKLEKRKSKLNDQKVLFKD